VDRKGKETKLADIQGALFGVRVAPDGSRAAAIKTQNGSRASDIWMYELPSGTPTRLTSTENTSWPLFSRDGKTITFVESTNNPGIYSVPTDGSIMVARRQLAGLFADFEQRVAGIYPAYERLG
jgi:Tol biopolymer transport system component